MVMMSSARVIKGLVPHLEELHHLYQALLKARKQRGAIDFETIETKFIFNAMGRIDRIEPVVRNDAHKIIEECMILANIAAANFMENIKSLHSIVFMLLRVKKN